MVSLRVSQWDANIFSHEVAHLFLFFCCCCCHLYLSTGLVMINVLIQLYLSTDLVVIISSIAALVLVAISKAASTPVSLVRFLPLLRVLRFDRQGGTWKLLASVIYIHRQVSDL